MKPNEELELIDQLTLSAKNITIELLKGKVEKLKAQLAAQSPWTRIDPADPATLPKYHTPVLVSVYYLGVGSRVFKADCDTLGVFTDHRGSELGGTVYAWLPLPDPAPYPNEETP